MFYTNSESKASLTASSEVTLYYENSVHKYVPSSYDNSEVFLALYPGTIRFRPSDQTYAFA